MRIFVRPEYFLGTSCETHMVDLMTTIKEEDFHEFTHHENTVCDVFAPKGNLSKFFKYRFIVERSISSLSGKLAGIVLNAFN
ncbi:unnamed protein product [Rhizophagus irregularis]|nr:unnamed protein product [Rhizophagus irregularis]